MIVDVSQFLFTPFHKKRKLEKRIWGEDVCPHHLKLVSNSRNTWSGQRASSLVLTDADLTLPLCSHFPAPWSSQRGSSLRSEAGLKEQVPTRLDGSCALELMRQAPGVGSCSPAPQLLLVFLSLGRKQKAWVWREIPPSLQFSISCCKPILLSPRVEQ